MSSTPNGPAVSVGAARTEVIASRKALRVVAPKQQNTEDVLDYGSLTVALWDPHVVRYEAPTSSPISDKDLQAQVVRGIRSQLQGLLLDDTQESEGAKDFKLVVVFDQVFAASQPSAIIDIVCNSAQMYHALLDSLKCIQVVNDYNAASTYTASLVRSSQTSRLLPVLLSVTALKRNEVRAFQQALEVMAAPIGSLTNILRVAVVDRGNHDNEKELERVVLAYINLSPSSMDLSYPELQHRRLDKFDWAGATGTQTVKVEYQDLNLACYQQYVAEHREGASESPSSPRAGQSQANPTQVKTEESERPIKKEELESPIKKEDSESPIKKRKQGGT